MVIRIDRKRKSVKSMSWASFIMNVIDEKYFF